MALSNRARSARFARRSPYRGLGSRSRHARCLRLGPRSLRPTPGGIDLCLVTDVPLDDVAAHLRSQSVVIEHGPVAKTGARSALRSLYFRDPDGNLIEVSNEVGR